MSRASTNAVASLFAGLTMASMVAFVAWMFGVDLFTRGCGSGIAWAAILYVFVDATLCSDGGGKKGVEK